MDHWTHQLSCWSVKTKAVYLTTVNTVRHSRPAYMSNNTFGFQHLICKHFPMLNWLSFGYLHCKPQCGNIESWGSGPLLHMARVLVHLGILLMLMLTIMLHIELGGHCFAWQGTHPCVNCSSSCPNFILTELPFRAKLSCAGQQWHRVRSKIVKIIKIFEKLEHVKTNKQQIRSDFFFLFLNIWSVTSACRIQV